MATSVVKQGPLSRYVKLRVAHAPGMPGRFSPPPWISDTGMHHGTCVTHVPWCMPGSLISGFLWSWWRGKRSRRMRNPQLYVSGKRPMGNKYLWCSAYFVAINWGTKYWNIHFYDMKIMSVTDSNTRQQEEPTEHRIHGHVHKLSLIYQQVYQFVTDYFSSEL